MVNPTMVKTVSLIKVAMSDMQFSKMAVGSMRRTVTLLGLYARHQVIRNLPL